MLEKWKEQANYIAKKGGYFTTDELDAKSRALLH